MELIDNAKRDRWYYLVSFSLAVMLVFLGYLFMDIYPFGDSTLLVMDLHGQYFPMINNLKSAISDGNLLYSFSSGLGFNLLAQTAYYTNSIFWYIIALLPAKMIIPALQLVIALKFGLAGLTFSYFLQRKNGEFSALTVALSSAYALCGYSLAYISQTMWTDAVILLPLVISGLEIMLDKKRPLLYFVSLTMLLFSNFYVGFGVCIFTALYFVAYEFSEKRPIKQRLKHLGYFSLYSLLSGGASAVFLIPTYLAIGRTKAGSLGFEGELEIYHSFEEVIESMMPFSGIELEFGVPNIYCGVFVLICIFLFIFNGNIPIRKRILNTLLFSFLMLSFELNLLDFIWHGFHYPNQLPGRQSFVFVFLALFIVHDAMFNLKHIKPQYTALSVALPIGLLAWTIITKKDEENTLIIGGVLLLMYALIFALPKNIQKSLNSSLVALVIVFEIGCNALYVLGSQTRVYSYDYYTYHYDEMETLTEKYESGNDDFWRSESTPYLSFNSGQLFAHKGLSYYSSMMSGAAYDFFGNIGFGIYAKNVSSIYSPTPVVNTMLGVRYVYDRYDSSTLSTLEERETVASTTVRENKYYLPFAFTVDEKMLDLGTDAHGEPLEYQNDMLIATGATDEDVFVPVTTSEELHNATVSHGADGNKYYLRKDPSYQVVCDFTCTAETDGDYYITSAFRAGTLKLYVNGVYQKDFSTAFHKVYFLGNYPAGTTLKVTLTADYSYALYGVDFYRFDEEAFGKAYDELLPGAVDVESASPTRFEATVNAGDGGLLYTSIPYDGGWSLYVDGEKTELQTVAGFLCAAKIESGEHTLVFSYSPPGFYLGLCISVASIAAVAVICIIKKKRKIT